MAITGANLLTGLSKFLNDYFTSTTTAAGNAAGSTLYDGALSKYHDNRLQDQYIRITSGANQYEVRTTESNEELSGQLSFVNPFTAQVASSVTYELHRFDPAKKFRALDDARFDMFDGAYQLIYDETVTADGRTFTFPVPSSLTEGPISVWEEVPIAAQNILWNFVSDAVGDSTSNWTAANCTASTVSIDYTDLLIPKYDYAATKLVTAASTAATYVQTVANMANSMTAAKAADRTMTFAAWVYCTEASKVRLQITDDVDTASGDYHSGSGWQLLSVEKTVAGNNATTLSITFDIASTANASTIYWNRAWFYFGESGRVTECYQDQSFPSVRHDSVTHTVTLPRPPARGHQLRMVGQGILSELGSDTTTQTTNTMELTTETAQILYAGAARLLLEWEGLTANDVPDVFTRIQLVERRARRMAPFKIVQPTKSIVSPYWS